MASFPLMTLNENKDYDFSLCSLFFFLLLSRISFPSNAIYDTQFACWLKKDNGLIVQGCLRKREKARKLYEKCFEAKRHGNKIDNCNWKPVLSFHPRDASPPSVTVNRKLWQPHSAVNRHRWSFKKRSWLLLWESRWDPWASSVLERMIRRCKCNWFFPPTPCGVDNCVFPGLYDEW